MRFLYLFPELIITEGSSCSPNHKANRKIVHYNFGTVLNLLNKINEAIIGGLPQFLISSIPRLIRSSFKWRVTVSGELMFLESYGYCDVKNTVTAFMTARNNFSLRFLINIVTLLLLIFRRVSH